MVAEPGSRAYSAIDRWSAALIELQAYIAGPFARV
jgi:hypothetical protein